MGENVVYVSPREEDKDKYPEFPMRRQKLVTNFFIDNTEKYRKETIGKYEILPPDDDEFEYEEETDKLALFLNFIKFSFITIPKMLFDKYDSIKMSFGEENLSLKKIHHAPLILFSRLSYYHQFSFLGLCAIGAYYSVRHLLNNMALSNIPSDYVQKKVLIVSNGPSNIAFHLARSILYYSPTNITILTNSAEHFQQLQTLHDKIISKNNDSSNKKKRKNFFFIKKFTSIDRLPKIIEDISGEMGGIDVLILNPGVDRLEPSICYTTDSNYKIFKAASEAARPSLLQSKSPRLIVNCSIDFVPLKFIHFIFDELVKIRDHFSTFQDDFFVDSKEFDRNGKSINVSVVLPSDVVNDSPTPRFEFSSVFKWLFSTHRDVITPLAASKSILLLASKGVSEYGFDYDI